MSSEPKNLTLRYCPVVGHNVVIEYQYGEGYRPGKETLGAENCHYARICREEHGKCTNRLFRSY